MKNTLYWLLIPLAMACSTPKVTNTEMPLLKISENKRFFVDENNKPFFWLGDTGWLLFKKLDRDDAEKYLADRKAKGFNVVQVMVIHDINTPVNVYGDSAFVDKDISRPMVTEGSSPVNDRAYDYWDHVDYIIDLAAEKEIYMALVPLWGSNVKNKLVNTVRAEKYATWLADRYKDRKNIIWLNGGDTDGGDSTITWQAMGNAIDHRDQNHLITFHPRGRLQSSMWFHHEEWLDFNMFQSGHRRYDQDDTELNYGEDNWRYVEADYNLKPIKPTIDGEPSYEGIPQGLHDTTQPYWNDDDIRRYAYWSVFSGAFGFTYGHNAVMQFYRPTDTDVAFGARIYWEPALNEPGAQQMIYLKDLILSRPFLRTFPDNSLIADDQGEQYDHLTTLRSDHHAFIYTYTGRSMQVKMGVLDGKKLKASWYSPRDGSWELIGEFENNGEQEFLPPGNPVNGNDWVLVLDSVNK